MASRKSSATTATAPASGRAQRSAYTASGAIRNAHRAVAASAGPAATTTVDALPVSSEPSPTPDYRLPYGMAPAPVREPTASKPFDLGDLDPSWRGWKVVYNLDVELGAYNKIMDMLDMVSGSNVAQEQQMEAIRITQEFVTMILLAWNFVDRTGVPYPQPYEDGAAHCPQTLLFHIASAFGRVVKPPKI